MLPIKQSGRSVTRNRAEAIDNVLSFLFLSENKESWDWIRPYCEGAHIAKAVEIFNKVGLHHFDGADISNLYESLGNTTSYQQLVLNPFNPELQTEFLALPGPWNYCYAGYFPEVLNIYPEHASGRQYLFSLMRHRTVPLRDVRGLFTLRSASVVEKSEAHLFNDGSYISFREYLQHFAKAWHVVGCPVEIDPPQKLEDVEQQTLWLARSMAFTNDYDWSIHMGFNVKAIPTVSIPSDPVGAREVFRLRDLPAGRSRREALRHWVTGHVRRRIEPEYVETYIWPYLRGAEEFTWNGLYCKIQPSAYDLRKASQYQAIRKKGVAA
jgi:hypothetical protein